MEGGEGRALLLADLAWALTAASHDLQRVLDTAASSAAALVGDGAVLRLAGTDGFLADTAVYHPGADRAAAIRAIVDLPDVKIYLPACDEHTAPPPAPPPEAAGTVDGARTGTHVLVVEDSPELAAVVQRLLDRAGYRVTVCLDPVQALDIVLPDHHPHRGRTSTQAGRAGRGLNSRPQSRPARRPIG